MIFGFIKIYGTNLSLIIPHFLSSRPEFYISVDVLKLAVLAVFSVELRISLYPCRYRKSVAYSLLALLKFNIMIKTSVILVCLMATMTISYGQSILNRIKDKVKNKVEQKIEEGIDKGIDKAEH